MGLHILCALGSVRRTDVGGANYCYEVMQIASLSTFTNYSFPIAGVKGGRNASVLIQYIQYGPAYIMCTVGTVRRS